MLLEKAERFRVEPGHSGFRDGGWHGAGPARIQSRHHSIMNLLTVRFGHLPKQVPPRIRSIDDFETLESLTVKAAIAESLEDFIEYIDEQVAEPQSAS